MILRALLYAWGFAGALFLAAVALAWMRDEERCELREENARLGLENEDLRSRVRQLLPEVLV